MTLKFNQIIEHKKNDLTKKNSVDTRLVDELPKEKHIFIDRILRLAQEENKLSVSQVRDETITVLAAVSSIWFSGVGQKR